MRVFAIVILLASMALAGCTVPEESDDENELIGVCPHWHPRMEVEGTVTLDGTDDATNASWMPRDPMGEPQPFENELPFDRIQVRVTGQINGTVRLTASAPGQGDSFLPIYDYESDTLRSLAEVRLIGDQQDRLFEVYLSPVSQDAAPQPGPVALHWQMLGDGDADLALHITYMDKVCGVP